MSSDETVAEAADRQANFQPPARLLRNVPDDRIAEAAAYIQQQWQTTPKIGVVLGTGLGPLADSITADAVIDYRDIPHFPRSTALAHKGKLVCGSLAGVSVVAMQGRCHIYEGYDLATLALPVLTMRALGAEILILSNASGGVNPQFKCGDVMVQDDHINFMFTSPLAGVQLDAAASAEMLRFGRPMATPYCPRLADQALAIARRNNIPAHRGVYVAVTGPSYETRSEYRLFRKLGGDTVGMSTVPEAIAAASVGMRTLALSVITNVAKPDAPEKVDAEDVVNVAAAVEPLLREIVLQVFEEVG